MLRCWLLGSGILTKQVLTPTTTGPGGELETCCAKKLDSSRNHSSRDFENKACVFTYLKFCREHFLSANMTDLSSQLLYRRTIQVSLKYRYFETQNCRHVAQGRRAKKR